MFQRTPSSIDVRGNRPTDPAWAESLQPGWQQRADRQLRHHRDGRPSADEDLVSDGWTEILRKLRPRHGRSGSPGMTPERDRGAGRDGRLREDGADPLAASTRSCDDPATAEALKPWYRQFCKRPCFHDDYLPTFNRPNVTLVDTARPGRRAHHRARRRRRRRGVRGRLPDLRHRLRGRHRVHAAGRVRDLRSRRADAEREVGTAGGDVPRARQPTGSRTACSWAAIQSGVSPNFTELYNEQSRARRVRRRRGRARGARAIEPTEAAEEAWVRTLAESTRAAPTFQHECTPGYYNNEGARARVRVGSAATTAAGAGVLHDPARLARRRWPRRPRARLIAAARARRSVGAKRPVPSWAHVCTTESLSRAHQPGLRAIASSTAGNSTRSSAGCGAAAAA